MRCVAVIGRAGLACLLLSAATSAVHAAEYLVHFDQPVYVVNGPGDPITAHLLIDAPPDRDRDQAVPGGLFSFAAEASWNPAKASIGGVGDVVAAPPLDYFDFAPGAFVSVAAGVAGVKGNINLQVDPLIPYEGTLLATFTWTNLASGPDSYPLNLDFFRTVGPNEQFFLNGLGAVLDADVMFVPSEVVIVPEPGAATASALVVLAGVFFCYGRRSPTAFLTLT